VSVASGGSERPERPRVGRGRARGNLGTSGAAGLDHGVVGCTPCTLPDYFDKCWKLIRHSMRLMGMLIQYTKSVQTQTPVEIRWRQKRAHYIDDILV